MPRLRVVSRRSGEDRSEVARRKREIAQLLESGKTPELVSPRAALILARAAEIALTNDQVVLEAAALFKRTIASLDELGEADLRRLLKHLDQLRRPALD